MFVNWFFLFALEDFFFCFTFAMSLFYQFLMLEMAKCSRLYFKCLAIIVIIIFICFIQECTIFFNFFLSSFSDES